MIKFKISMLTPVLYRSKMIFLRTILTDYLNQTNQYQEQYDGRLLTKTRVEYTYNEKFSEEENSQKTLTFSMNKNITTDNQIYNNPFTDLLHVGSLLLLEDKYDNSHLFYITDIKYNLQEFNSIYEITCQDAFSYLLTKQRSGYQILNDSSTDSFIGALNIDDWTKKIVQDCYINYTYVPLNIGLYESANESLNTFKENQTDLINVKRIIKECFDHNEYKELYTTFPFEGSGSAGSILIDLGAELGMHLKVAEKLSSVDVQLTDLDEKWLQDFDEKLLLTSDVVEIYKYFWFEPAKNTTRLDFTYYTPRSSIQNFDFSYKGSSLTTVLNVTGPTIQDEEITLFPKIPPFFISLFGYDSYWTQTKFEPGMFTALCKQQNFLGSLEDEFNNEEKPNDFSYTIGGDAEGIVLNVKWLSALDPFRLYDYIHFNATINNQKVSSQITVRSPSGNLNTYTPDTSIWTIKIKPADSTEVVEISEAVEHISDLIRHWEPIDNDYDFQICIKGVSGNIVSSQVAIGFSHNVTDEDLEFAQVADNCPWLENKIIDLQYFLDQNIISKSEYSQIMDIFKNQLRIINGQLMFCAQEYYNALHYQTQQLAQLTADLDVLGATIDNTFIQGYKDKKAANNLDSFVNAYDHMFVQGISNKTNLLNYNNIKAQYLNNFFDAQQRFLKNIKNFRDYFNTPVDATPVYNYKITWINNDNNQNIYTSDLDWSLLTSSIPTWLYDSNEDSLTYGKSFFELYSSADENLHRTSVPIADKSMLGQLYQLKERLEPIEITQKELYRSDLTYFIKDGTTYNIIEWEDILKRYINNLAEPVYYYKKPIEKQKIYYEDNEKRNNLITKYFEYFKAASLQGLVEQELSNNDAYKIYDAFLPISQYYGYDEKDTEYIFDSVRPSNENSYYRYTRPITWQGRLAGSVVSRVLLGWNWAFAWNALSNFINMRHGFNKEGQSIYTLDSKNITEYDNTNPTIDTDDKTENPYTIITYWCDSREPFYMSTSQLPEGFKNKETPSLVDYETIGFTPQSAATKQLRYEANQLKLLTNKSILRYTGTYIMIPFRESWLNNGKTIAGLFDEGKATDVLLHPLMTNSILIPDEAWKNFKNSDGSIKQTISLESMLSGTEFKFKADSNYLIKGPNKKDSETDWYLFVCEICDYQLEQITEENFNPSLVWYDKNGLVVRPNELDNLTIGLYKQPEAYELATDFDINKKYYVLSEDNSYIIIYGIHSLPFNDDIKYYYKANTLANFNFVDKDHKDFTFTLQIKNKESELVSIEDITLHFNANGYAATTVGNYDFLEFHLDSTQRSIADGISTNGDFWFAYHQRIDDPFFHERAAMIEAQLTEYWSGAYLASKYCDYFIPESWLPSDEGIRNNFSALLYSTNDNNKHISLLPALIPDAQVFTQNGVTEFKKYHYTLDSNYESAGTSLSPVQEMFTILNESINDWYRIENGTTTYYYNATPETGCSWSKFIRQYFGYNYPRVSGLYKMAFDVLKNNYLHYPLTLYEQKKQEQHDLWQFIYNNYNFLILENNYENTTATKSTDLLKLAQYAFRDYQKPEAQYNITTIDLSSLANYQNFDYEGVEIRVGDGIRINAQDYYNSYDTLYKDLSQFLFVTSIQYDLRKATDISLGVNSIKYQDKLIDKLIQYIR